MVYLPVDNATFMKVLQAQDDASRVKDGARLAKNIGVDVHHEITTCSVLHHEANVSLLQNLKIKKVSRE